MLAFEWYIGTQTSLHPKLCHSCFYGDYRQRWKTHRRWKRGTSFVNSAAEKLNTKSWGVQSVICAFSHNMTKWKKERNRPGRRSVQVPTSSRLPVRLESSNLVDLKMIWADMILEMNGMEQFVRYACITTNESEGVFNLTGNSTKTLARCGLCADYIEGISWYSKQKNPAKILKIIGNMELCYKSLGPVLRGLAKSSPRFLKDMHYQLMVENNVELEWDEMHGHYAGHVIIHIGKYRRTPCHTDHGNGDETLYCPVSNLNKEMTWYFEQAGAILSNADLDSHYVAAWLHHAFV
jgi:hypothetical protein